MIWERKKLNGHTILPAKIPTNFDIYETKNQVRCAFNQDIREDMF